MTEPVSPGVQLRTKTQELLKNQSQEQAATRLNRALLEDAYPTDLARSLETSWIVKDGAMASTGAGRGVIYTKGDYTNYRIIIDVRQDSGNHQPCVLLFCNRPADGEKGLDALGGIQFQVPNGGHWDYRPGFNNGGSGFKNPVKTKYNNHEWSQVEILVNARAGTARMAVAQPVGTKATENLDYNNSDAGKIGPFALQMHNAGLFDVYKDLRIEIDPNEDKLITTE
jgi:3-keto-disaccharide hydrolase